MGVEGNPGKRYSLSAETQTSVARPWAGGVSEPRVAEVQGSPGKGQRKGGVGRQVPDDTGPCKGLCCLRV